MPMSKVDGNVRKTDMPGEEELHLLQRKLENHIVQQDDRWDQLIQSQEKTDESIKELASCTAELHASTMDIVEAWNTGASVIKFGGTVGRFVKWLAGFAIIGGIISWFGGIKP